jgi:phosphoglycerate dehydrogenase-like enzyme
MPADELRRANYVITNFRGVSASPLTEAVLTMMLTHAKSWSLFQDQQRRHVWQRHMISELHGKTVGIIGLGGIGREVARVCSCLGMRVVAVRRGEPTDAAIAPVDKMFPRAQLHDLLAESDFVVCSAPATPETYHMIGERELRRMKPSAYLINVGRGQLIDEPVLARALAEGWIAGAGLDVFEQEPLPHDSSLWDLPNVVLLPHQGADTARYLDRGVELIRENLQRYVDGRPLLNTVDPARGY